MGTTRDIAEFAHKTTFDDFDSALVKHVKDVLLSSVGMTIAGVSTPTGRVVLSYVKECAAPEEALAKLDGLKEKLPALQAIDLHYLSKCHEVRSMALCAELTFRAALMRSESRGFHFREDFPERDDKNWLKWIILKQDSGKMKLSTQLIPISKYKIKPVN